MRRGLGVQASCLTSGGVETHFGGAYPELGLTDSRTMAIKRPVALASSWRPVMFRAHDRLDAHLGLQSGIGPLTEGHGPPSDRQGGCEAHQGDQTHGPGPQRSCSCLAAKPQAPAGRGPDGVTHLELALRRALTGPVTEELAPISARRCRTGMVRLLPRPCTARIGGVAGRLAAFQQANVTTSGQMLFCLQ